MSEWPTSCPPAAVASSVAPIIVTSLPPDPDAAMVLSHAQADAAPTPELRAPIQYEIPLKDTVAAPPDPRRAPARRQENGWTA